MGEWILLSPAMLGFAAAALVPVALYLWRQPLRQELPWAAMIFLERAYARVGRRRSWLQYLLLLLRVLIVLTFAIAWSEPRWRSATGGELASEWHLICVDHSLSMTAESAARDSAWERARTQARQLIRTNEGRCYFSILLAGEPPNWIIEQPQQEPNRVVMELDRLSCGQGGVDWGEVVETATAGIARWRESTRAKSICVHFFTDCQGANWSSQTIADVTTAVNGVPNVRWELHDVGRLIESNSTVTDLRCNDPWVTTSTAAEFTASITHAGSRERSTSLRWLVDGEEVGRDEIRLIPGETVRASRRHTLTKAGEHVVAVELEADSFKGDDRCEMVVQVRERVRILALGGRRGETHPFKLALESVGPQGILAVDEINDTGPFRSELSSYDLILIANFPSLTAEEEARLQAFVESGGGLILVCGDLTSAEWLARNSAFWPGTLLSAETFPQAVTFDPLDYKHPALGKFRNFTRSGLLTTPTWRAWKLKRHPQAERVLAFSHGEDALLTLSQGRGRVILSAFPWSGLSRTTLADGSDTPWSAFDTWPSFVPLVNELVRTAVVGKQAAGGEIGTVLSGEAGNMSGGVTVVLPDESVAQARMTTQENRRVWSFSQTTLAGIYRVEVGNPGDAQRLFAIHVPSVECQLSQVAAKEITQHWQGSSRSIAGVGNGWREHHALASLMVFVVALLSLETAVTWLLSREESR